MDSSLYNNIVDKSLYDYSSPGACGVDVPEVSLKELRIGCAVRSDVNWPEMSEPPVVRYFTLLSALNKASPDICFYPLGSCTMKYNPRLNEVVASLSGFADIHPMQQPEDVQGALRVMYELQERLKIISGLDAVSLCPAAGAHGEFAGIKIIKKALFHKGLSHKDTILIPESAHGTNPATAALCGYKIKSLPANAEGYVEADTVRAMIDENTAAIMITNPNTCGVFEEHAVAVADLIHEVGGYVYYDGANMNALVGKIRPVDLGADVMHYNLHKTFSTPHGGGGPGSGPVAVRADLADFLPVPYVVKRDGLYSLVEQHELSIGRIRSFNGQFAVILRALTYIMSCGGDGLCSVAEDAVISANYVRAMLKDDYFMPFTKCMHECLLSDKWQAHTGVTTDVIAKTLIEYGMHPMTVYFPLVVSGAMLIEPTETESKDEIDRFIAVMRMIAERVRAGDVEALKDNPRNMPVRRVDEVKAARNPILRG